MEELLQRAQQDPNAFGEIYERTIQAVFRYCMVLTSGDEDMSWDLCSETYIKAMKALPLYQDKGYQYTSYLYRIARNIFIDEVRRKKKEQVQRQYIVDEDGEVAGDEEDMPDSLLLLEEEDVERAGFLQKVREIVTTLKPEEQEMLHMRFEQEMKYMEIAQILGIPLSSVKVKFHRLFKKLQQIFASLSSKEDT